MLLDSPVLIFTADWLREVLSKVHEQATGPLLYSLVEYSSLCDMCEHQLALNNPTSVQQAFVKCTV
jgi:hypothetical protein